MGCLKNLEGGMTQPDSLPAISSTGVYMQSKSFDFFSWLLSSGLRHFLCQIFHHISSVWKTQNSRDSPSCMHFEPFQMRSLSIMLLVPSSSQCFQLQPSLIRSHMQEYWNWQWIQRQIRQWGQKTHQTYTKETKDYMMECTSLMSWCWIYRNL